MLNMLLPRLVLFRKEVVQLWKAFFAPETPLHLKAATLFVAFYLVNPLDIIPDVIPILGWVDDMILLPLMVWWHAGILTVEPMARGRLRLRPEQKASLYG